MGKVTIIIIFLLTGKVIMEHLTVPTDKHLTFPDPTSRAIKLK